MPTRCFAARFELTRCHIEISAGQSHRYRARLWMQDRAMIRPVLTAAGHLAEIADDSEDSALARAVDVLETRFGTLMAAPEPCREPQFHIKDEAAPVRWS